MSQLDAARSSLVEVTRRHSRVAHEAEDLAHDLILSALRRGLPLEPDVLLGHAHGAARRHAAFLARSALRRRARELQVAASPVIDTDAADPDPEARPYSTLSPVLQTTLALLVMGLEKAELCVALGVSDAALRKRFQSLREQAPLTRPELPLAARTPALLQQRRTHVELLPLLASRFHGADPPRIVAASDPDGHGLIFTHVLTERPSAATSGKDAGASPAGARPNPEGSPCSTLRSRISRSSSS